jgi:hypothetical protein
MRAPDAAPLASFPCHAASHFGFCERPALFSRRNLQAENRLRNCLFFRILVSAAVRQALALDTLKSKSRPFPIGNAKAGTIVIAELKLCEVALQMLFAAERVGPAHTALEHAKEVFDVVRGETSGI